MMQSSMFGDKINSQAAMRDKEALLRPLENKDKEELRELLENDSKMEEHIRSVELESRKIMMDQKDVIMMQSKSLAEYNLTFEPRLQQGRDNLKQLMVQIERVRNAVVEKQARLQNCTTAETVLALLQTAAVELEDDSEKLAESFYQKEIDADDFLDKFQDVRKQMHLRRIKAEKMVELVTQQNARPLSGPRRAAPLPPYPVGPMFMNNNI